MTLSIPTGRYKESFPWKYFHAYMESVSVNLGYSRRSENDFAYFMHSIAGSTLSKSLTTLLSVA